MIKKSEKLKKQLHVLVAEYGLTHPLVLECSQELDKVILEIQLQARCKI